MNLIGITGKKRSGKDTVATAMQRHFAGRTQKIAFADQLKKEVCLALRIHFEQLEANKEFYRPILQWWGTNWRRGHDHDYWVNQWLDFWSENVKFKFCETIIAPDVRFLNEAAAIRDRGGIIVRVVKIGQPDDDRHGSETEMDNIEADAIIEAEDGDHEAIEWAVQHMPIFQKMR
jgi:hypothetical protein